MKNGIVGARSKHIKIRFAWIKESIEAGDFELKYKSTKEMLADGLTKPKQGIEYEEFKIGAGIQTSTKERAEESETSVVQVLNPVVQDRRK